MKPASEAQQRCFEEVGRCLREAFGGVVEESEEEATYRLPLGPYGIRVTVSRIDDDEAVVDVYTWLGRDLAVTPEVARFLLERNAQLRFGSLGVDPDGDILLGHSLFCEQADTLVLRRLVEMLAAVAEELEGELGKRFA